MSETRTKQATTDTCHRDVDGTHDHGWREEKRTAGAHFQKNQAQPCHNAVQRIATHCFRLNTEKALVHPVQNRTWLSGSQSGNVTPPLPVLSPP